MTRQRQEISEDIEYTKKQIRRNKFSTYVDKIMSYLAAGLVGAQVWSLYELPKGELKSTISCAAETALFLAASYILFLRSERGREKLDTGREQINYLEEQLKNAS